MYKLLIVEDNPIQIDSLLTFVDWKSLLIAEIQFAKNGIEGVAKFREISPDIIITDVCMPKMDGIEMVRTIRELNQDVQIIFISAHNDFEYAQKVIGFDACSYLLKPFSPAQLTETVNIAIENLQKKNHAKQLQKDFSESLNAYREMMLHLLKNNGLLYMHSFNETEKNLFFGNYNTFILFKVVFDIPDEENIDIPFVLLNAFKDHLFKNLEGVGILETNNSLLFLIYDTTFDETDALIDTLTTSLDHITANISAPVEALRIGVSESFSDISLIQKMYRQAESALENQYIPVSTNVYVYDKLEDSSITTSTSELKTRLEKLLNCYNADEIEHILNDFFPESFYSMVSLKAVCFAFVAAIQLILIEYNMDINTILDADIWKKLKSIETIPDPRQWIKNIITALYEAVNENPKNKYDKIINDIKLYINENYATIRNLEQITSTFLISTSYAKQIFKQHTGQSIFEYLTITRINAAKQFLKDPYIKVYEVCEKVGYKKPSHFTALFKKYTGQTPQQFQKND